MSPQTAAVPNAVTNDENSIESAGDDDRLVAEAIQLFKDGRSAYGDPDPFNLVIDTPEEAIRDYQARVWGSCTLPGCVALAGLWLGPSLDRVPFDDYRGAGVWGGRMLVFDECECKQIVSGGCLIQGLGIIPIGKAGKWVTVGGKQVWVVVKSSDEVADVAGGYTKHGADVVGDTANIISDVPRTTPNGMAVRLCRSFSADTEVLMADGTTKPISEIEVGDVVWALDPESGVEGERTVTGVWPHYDWLLNFAVGDGFVQTTEDHHFWNESDREWQETAHIDIGDVLLTADGSFVVAGGLDWTSRTYGEAFDLTVEGLHTYFVDFGAGNVLVHNTDCSFDELGGLAQYVDRADLIDGIVEHAAARGRAILPSQIDDALATTGTRIRDGIPGRDNAVRFELDDLL